MNDAAWTFLIVFALVIGMAIGANFQERHSGYECNNSGETTLANSRYKCEKL